MLLSLSPPPHWCILTLFLLGGCSRQRHQTRFLFLVSGAKAVGEWPLKVGASSERSIVERAPPCTGTTDLHFVWATPLEGFRAGTSLFSCRGEEDPLSMKLVFHPGKEARDSEPLTIHFHALIEGPLLPEIVSSNWVV